MRTTSLLMIGLVALAANAMADELDPVAAGVPQGLVVQQAQDGKRVVFKATLDKGVVQSEAAAAEVLKTSVKEENKVQDVNPLTELDRVSSDDSWHYSWNCYSHSNYYSGYYSYTYYRSNCSYDYYPSYSYSYRGYSYTYYYTPSYYGYQSGCRYDDHWGWHYGRSYGWR